MLTWPHLFTVLTPTYNRAHTLGRVYASLCEQSFNDFEWLVIDDGSTDNTRELVQAWEQQAPFPIRYVWQANQHKKAAFNHGVRLAKGELIVALDSDDTLEVNALRTMAELWADIPLANRAVFVAITGLCSRPDGKVVGDLYPKDIFDSNALDIHFRYKVRGEKFGFLRTDVLRQFPFPEDVPGFVPESLVWRAIARAGYKIRFVNQIFRVYYDSTDSLSRQGKESQQHALGLWLLAQDMVVECLPWFRYQPLEFLKAAARYTRFSLHLRLAGQPYPAGRRLRGIKARALVAIMWPLGLALFIRDRLRR